MGGAHAHGRDHDLSAADPGPVVRLVLVAVMVAIALAALVGLWRLWPDGDKVGSVPYYADGVSVTDATVTKVGEPCPVVIVDPDQLTAPEVERPKGCDELRVQPTSGPEAGTQVTVQATPDASRSGLEPGDTVRVFRIPGGEEASYAYAGVVRHQPLLLLALVAAAVILLVARLRGLLAMVGLGFAAAIGWWFMLPALLEGEAGLWVALTAASVILYVVLYLTHGVSLRTSVALAGTLLGVAVTALVGGWGVGSARLSGLGGEAGDALLLQAGDLPFRDLLLAAVVIAGIGVLNDVTITQASAVWELRAAGPAASRLELFRSGMRIGRDHIASTIYTIVFAYAGTSLALLALVSLYDRPLADLLLDEGVAEEVVRTLASTIGLVLAVPITTLLAVLVARGPASEHRHVHEAAETSA
ncbi:YibE/F family protein [Nocardioides sp.]|uniref:YibE/F family protein n=1 Tax=Nocardioides sp. TaxID=35761 RepID=UPI00352896AB